MKTTFNDQMIGARIEVVDAVNKSLVGIKGDVVDETKNTIVIDTNGGRKLLLKNTGAVFADSQ